MNEATFLSEQINAKQAVETGLIEPNTVITGQRLEDGSYHVLGRYADTTWVLPDILFPAGTKESDKKLDFSRVPQPFREALRFAMARHILTGIEGRNHARGGTFRQFFNMIVLFLTWLQGRGICRLREVTPLLAQQYVEHCKGLRNERGIPLSVQALTKRFSALEKLHILSQKSEDPMRYPWPESSSAHLAGLTGGRREATTKVIPEDILAPLFQSAVKWLDRADEILRVRDQIDAWRLEGMSRQSISWRSKKSGWSIQENEKAVIHLQTACMCIVLITSGIRVSELCSLESECRLTTLDNQGELFYWISGISYKTGVGSCEWLVSEVTHCSIEVAERIVKPLQAKLEQRIAELRTANTSASEITQLLEHRHRLFLGVYPVKNNRVQTLASLSVLQRLNSFATQSGIAWKFSPHQFRRTFAVYAAHSALGDLRYLRDHFKHWSLDMTALYAMSRKQDAELYDIVGLEALNIKIDLLEHWLEPDAILTGGAAEPILAFRTKNEDLATKEDRVEMAKAISPLVHLRATGVAWCTADTGGCNGGQGVEKTRCGDCDNAIIDESRRGVWQGIYAQQVELRHLTDIGPGGMERVERDIKRCESVLKSLGASKEDLANVAT